MIGASALEFLSGLLCLDPSLRLTAAQALRHRYLGGNESTDSLVKETLAQRQVKAEAEARWLEAKSKGIELATLEAAQLNQQAVDSPG